jgi:hypothetical protein
MDEIKTKVNDRLKRIANVLMLNASFIDNLGLLNGKMGIVIFFFHYSRYSGSEIYKEYASDLINEIYEEISTSTPMNFESGLTGIGWGIEYLIKNDFVQADTDEVLSDLDNTIYKHRINSPILIDTGCELFGYGFYYISRILGHKIDDNNLDTLIKKYHLIFLVDECERILAQKSYKGFDIESLSIDLINSFIWFLQEVQRLKIFPTKVDKICMSFPTYIETAINSSGDFSSLCLLLSLTENLIKIVKDKTVISSLKKLLEKLAVERIQTGQKDDEINVSIFIKNAWHQIVYRYSYNGNIFLVSSSNKYFKLLDNEGRWNDWLNNLNKDSFGMTGLAGLGLGMLKLLETELVVQGKLQNIS